MCAEKGSKEKINEEGTSFTFCKRSAFFGRGLSHAYTKGCSKCDHVEKTVLAGIMFSIRRQHFKGHILANMMSTTLPFSL